MCSAVCKPVSVCAVVCAAAMGKKRPLEQVSAESSDPEEEHSTEEPTAQARHTKKTRQSLPDAAAAEEERADEKGKISKVRLDLATLKDGLKENYKHIEPLRDKDAVFFCGDTGTGKSTTINFLLGCEMVRRSTFLGKCCYDCADPVAAIGHGAQACTEYPQAYQAADKEQLCLVDCPGFKDTRGVLKETLCNMCTHFAFQMAARVRAVALVIDCESITGARGSSIKSLLQTVAHLITIQEDDACPLLFLVTKVPSSGDAVRARDEFLSHVPNLKEGLPPEGKEAAGKLFDMMVANPDNVFVVDLDTTAQREAILNRAQQMTPIQPSRFRLVAHTGSQQLMKDILDSIAQLATPLVSSGLHSQQAIQINQKEVAQLTEEINQWRSSQADTDNEVNTLLKQYQNQLAKSRHKRIGIQRLNQQHQDATLKAQNDFEVWAQQLECSEPIIIAERIFTNRGLFFDLSQSFQYGGVPFTRVDSHVSKGEFVDEHINKAEGKYSVVWKHQLDDWSSLFTPERQCASLQIFVEPKKTVRAQQQATAFEQAIRDSQEQWDEDRERQKMVESQITYLEELEKHDLHQGKALIEGFKELAAKVEEQRRGRQQTLEVKSEGLKHTLGKIKDKGVEQDIELAHQLSELCDRMHVQMSRTMQRADNADWAWIDPTPKLMGLWEQFMGADMQSESPTDAKEQS